MYAVIDVETTGFNAKEEKVTEIAIILFDGRKIVDKYETLINPERKIPYRITKITGINDQMLENAPKFYEIAKKLIEMTEDTILVGHNINFDYRFLRSEFAEFNYDFNRDKLDTVRLARKTIPGQDSYSLPKLTKSLGIEHGIKHRAMGDALATLSLLKMILSIDKDAVNLSTRQLPAAISREDLKKIPKKTGVYYFKNSEGKIIYVGKSNNIHDRVVSHLNNHSTKKAVEMKNNICEIDFEITGSELIALLHESEEIKAHKPIYNRAQRRSIFQYGLFSNFDVEGYINFSIDKIEDMSKPLTSFSSNAEAKEFLNNMIDEYELCQKLCGIYKTKSSCFNHQIKKCYGACVGEETPENYNKRAMMLVEKLQLQYDNFIVFDKGRKVGEKSFVKIENGKYLGFGFIKETDYANDNKLDKNLNKKMNNRDVQSIIRSYMNRNKMEVRVYGY